MFNTVPSIQKTKTVKMFKISGFCFAFALIFVITSAEDCKPVKVVDNFDLEKFKGRYYQIKRYENKLQSGDCSTVDYTVKNSTFADFVVTQKNLQDGSISHLKGFISFDKPTPTEGKYTTVFDSGFVSTFYVLDVDYDNYVVLYSCIAKNKKDLLWVLSRHKTLTSDQEAKIERVFKANGVGDQKFLFDNQNSSVC